MFAFGESQVMIRCQKSRPKSESSAETQVKDISSTRSLTCCEGSNQKASQVSNMTRTIGSITRYARDHEHFGEDHFQHQVPL
jgi:hypothetical protein